MYLMRSDTAPRSRFLLMLLNNLALLPLSALSWAPLSSQYIFTNPSTPHTSVQHFPTIHESAVLARRILNLSTIATFATVFPANNDLQHANSNPPPYVSGAPIGLMEYYAACSPQSHHPTILAIDIATSFRNTRAGSNISLSLRWHPPADAPPSNDPYTYSAANMPRFSLEGYVEKIPSSEVKKNEIEECFFARHPDAIAWRPGNDIHESWWGKFIVKGIYWIGGFGDRAYIGWIPVEDWESVTEEEIENARLVGEEGFKWHGNEDL